MAILILKEEGKDLNLLNTVPTIVDIYLDTGLLLFRRLTQKKLMRCWLTSAPVMPPAGCSLRKGKTRGKIAS